MIALILAGGRSRRMGRDKLLIERPDGWRQIDWLAHLLQAAGLEVMLSTRGDALRRGDLPLVIDRHPRGGPLAALEAFHGRCPGQPVLVLGGDLFLMDAPTLAELIKGRDPSRAATCFANRIDGRPEPLFAVYEAPSIGLAAEWLARGECRACHFLAELDPKILELRSAAALDNVNTPQDLHEAFEKLRHGTLTKRVAVEHPGFSEAVETLACTLGGLVGELSFRHRWDAADENLAARINSHPAEWDAPVREGDRIVFASRAHSPG